MMTFEDVLFYLKKSFKIKRSGWENWLVLVKKPRLKTFVIMEILGDGSLKEYKIKVEDILAEDWMVEV